MAVAHGHLLRIYAAREQIPEYIAEILKANAWYQTTPKDIEAWPSNFALPMHRAVLRPLACVSRN